MAFVQTPVSTIAAADKTLSVTLGSALTTGKTLVAVVTCSAATNPTTFAVSMNSGAKTFTNAVTETPNADFGTCVGIFYRIIDGTETGQTVDLVVTATNTPDSSLWVGEVDDLAASSVLDKTASTPMTGGGDLRTSQSTGSSGTLAQTQEWCVAAWCTHQATVGDTYTGSFSEVLNESVASYNQVNIAVFESTSTASVSCTRNWTSPSTLCTAALATFKMAANNAPVATVPSSGTRTTSATTTALPGAMVVDGSSAISSVQVYCTSGDLTVTLSGSVVVSAGANGSSDLTVGSGASDTEYSTVLDTLVYQGDAAFHGKDTIHVIPSDDTLSDDKSFYVLNDPFTLTLTGTHQQLDTALSGLTVTLISGTTGTVTIVATDATSGTPLTDTKVLTINETNPIQAPTITSNGGGPTAAIQSQGGAVTVTTVVATDPQSLPITYSITGGADQSLFTLNSASGLLQFSPACDYHNPTDADTNNIYLVTVQASNGVVTDSQDLTITVLNAAPVITSDNGGATAALFVQTGRAAVTTVRATDANSDTLTYSISGGADQALFTIGSSSGILNFLSAPDVEDPQDDDLDNVYEVTVQASDGADTDTQALSITVTSMAHLLDVSALVQIRL